MIVDSPSTFRALEGMRALVTGGAGFIGSHLVDTLLGLGSRVRVLDDLSTGLESNLAQATDAELQIASITDHEACQEACRDVEVVFHQAALGSIPRSMRDPARTIAVNVSGTTNVLAAARDAGVRRVVYASSSSIYGDSTVLPREEGQEGRVLSPYALSKQMCETLAEHFGAVFGLGIIGLRYFNVFGPRQRPDGPYAAVVPRFIAAARAGEAPRIHGDGEQSRDFTFVADAVRANLLAAVAGPSACGRAYNVGCGAETSVRDLAALIRRAVGGPVAVHEATRPGDVRHSLASLRAVETALGYRPTVSLAEGLERTVLS